MGLRELKKQKTREAIADAAMELFVKRGFDHVTVAEVADAAGVSEKTVFNYFPTKEDLFFDEVDAHEAAIVAAVRDRRPGESIPAALCRENMEHCRRMCTPGFAGFAQLIEDSPALRGKELEVMARFTRALATALVEEAGCDELEAKVAASVLVGVHWQFFVTARERALAGRTGPGAERKLRADVARAYELLERGLGTLGRRPSTVR
ncbi:MAG TPA: TetR family transcriptional regulator [Gaiellaceae bacterium]|nr:TetR family transcriptional regulator [Gaiellaceae bacterium]